MSKIEPIFIFSLPRSGSTLMQRVLMGHSKISSVAEPHLLLPLVYTLKRDGVLARYSHYNVSTAVNDLVDNLPNKEKDYDKFVNEFVTNIYTSLSAEKSVFFLDKTPSYFWIIPEIERIFPNAKFIFMFRNPLQIFASIITTFTQNRFNKLQYFHQSIDEGLSLLTDGYDLLRSKSHKLCYEDFVTKPDVVLKELLDYLELDYEDSMLSEFKNQNTKGQLGDPTGINLYDHVSKKSMEKWKSVFNTVFRKIILKRYVKRLDENSLNILGYKKQNLLEDIDSIKLNGKHSLIRDFLDYSRFKLVFKYKLNIFFGKDLKWTKNEYLN